MSLDVTTLTHLIDQWTKEADEAELAARVSIHADYRARRRAEALACRDHAAALQSLLDGIPQEQEKGKMRLTRPEFIAGHLDAGHTVTKQADRVVCSCGSDYPSPALTQAPQKKADEPSCVQCGSSESPDGDWYRLCGPCRWHALPARPPSAPYPEPDYPTVHAYEQVCKARDKWQARAETAESSLSTLRDELQQTKAENERLKNQ